MIFKSIPISISIHLISIFSSLSPSLALSFFIDDHCRISLVILNCVTEYKRSLVMPDNCSTIDALIDLHLIVSFSFCSLSSTCRNQLVIYPFIVERCACPLNILDGFSSIYLRKLFCTWYMDDLELLSPGRNEDRTNERERDK